MRQETPDVEIWKLSLEEYVGVDFRKRFNRLRRRIVDGEKKERKGMPLSEFGQLGKDRNEFGRLAADISTHGRAVRSAIDAGKPVPAKARAFCA